MVRQGWVSDPGATSSFSPVLFTNGCYIFNPDPHTRSSDCLYAVASASSPPPLTSLHSASSR